MIMRKKSLKLLAFLFILIMGSLIVAYLVDEGYIFDSFDPGDRYQSSILNYMDVIYEDESDLYACNGGFSTTNRCPWVREHLGFDFAFKNNSVVKAAAPGQVSRILYYDWGESAENRFMVHVTIRFNKTTYVNYGFEPWTQNPNDHQHQKSLISVKVGDWVQQGDQIGIFLNVGPGAHIHFDVIENDVRVRIDKYYSSTAYARILAFVQSYQPYWPKFCYDGTEPLDYMIDIYQYSSDVQNISKTYSASTSCPWGSIHLGLDIKLYSNAKVRAAAPGQVINKSIGDRGLVSDRFYINLTIQYNDTTYIEYIFELMSNTYSYATTQLSEISVNIGDWVPIDWDLAFYKPANANSHIHFSVVENEMRPPLNKYFSSSAYNNMTDLLHSFSPTWNLIYS